MFGGGGDEVSIIPVVNPRGPVSVSSLVYFSSVFFSSKTSHPTLPLSLGACHIKSVSIRRGGGVMKPQEEKVMREERRNQIRVTVGEKK